MGDEHLAPRWRRFQIYATVPRPPVWLVADLNQTFAEPSDLYTFLESACCRCREVARPDNGAPRVVVDFLMSNSDPRREILRRYSSSQAGGATPWVPIAGTALGVLSPKAETPTELCRF